MRSMSRPQSGCILAIETAGVLQGRLAVLTVVVSNSGVDRSYPVHGLGIMAIRAHLLNKTIWGRSSWIAPLAPVHKNLPYKPMFPPGGNVEYIRASCFLPALDHVNELLDQSPSSSIPKSSSVLPNSDALPSRHSLMALGCGYRVRFVKLRLHHAPQLSRTSPDCLLQLHKGSQFLCLRNHRGHSIAKHRVNGEAPSPSVDH